jgi:geranylgeranyl pyrophosphate synthase
LRAATAIFEGDSFERLLPRAHAGPTLAENNGRQLDGLAPVAATEALARDFVLRGGKHFRPVITLAAFDAVTGGTATSPHGDESLAQIPDTVRRIALAMELFHKASLVHDDIEDDDPLRYGQPTLHRQFGIPLALNAGDYLIGLGYRVVAGGQGDLPSEMIGDILVRLADAHAKLCEGQGAELAWRGARDKRIEPLESLRIYALKTAPAFEAALYAGLRLGGAAEVYREPAARFARHLGVAFQILNDLDDWRDHQPNKGTAGGDVLAGRPTVLWAMALESLAPEDQRRLVELVSNVPGDGEATIRQVRDLYGRAGVYDKAVRLVAKHRDRAHAVADTIQPDALCRLLHYLADTILDG